jgi:multiple sugar transport system substrate-binding protein
MQERRTELAGIVLLASVLLAACGPGAQPSVKLAAVGEKPDTLTLWSNPSFGSYEDYLKEQLAAFKKKYPNITVTYEILSAAQLEEKSNVALAASTPPDVMFGSLATHWLRSQVPVADYMTKADLDDVFDAAKKRATFQGKIWFIPLYQTIVSMAGNRALLEQAGVDWRAVQRKGWTWSEFVTAMQRVKATVPNVSPFVWPGKSGDAELFREFLANDGLTYAVTPSGTFTFTGPRVVETLQFMTDLYNKHGISPKDVAALDHQRQTDLFESGKAAVSARQGPDVLAVQKRYKQMVAEGKPLKAGVVPMDAVLLPFPHNQGQAEATFGGGGGYQVFLQKGRRVEEQHVQDAIALARFLTDTDNEGSFALRLNLLPSRKSALDKFKAELNLADPNMQFFARYAGVALPPNFLDTATEKRAASVQRDAIVPNWEAAAAGRKTPQQAVDDMTRTAKNILAQP